MRGAMRGLPLLQGRTFPSSPSGKESRPPGNPVTDLRVYEDQGSPAQAPTYTVRWAMWPEAAQRGLGGAARMSQIDHAARTEAIPGTRLRWWTELPLIVLVYGAYSAGR